MMLRKQMIRLSCSRALVGRKREDETRESSYRRSVLDTLAANSAGIISVLLSTIVGSSLLDNGGISFGGLWAQWAV